MQLIALEGLSDAAAVASAKAADIYGLSIVAEVSRFFRVFFCLYHDFTLVVLFDCEVQFNLG